MGRIRLRGATAATNEQDGVRPVVLQLAGGVEISIPHRRPVAAESRAGDHFLVIANAADRYHQQAVGSQRQPVEAEKLVDFRRGNWDRRDAAKWIIFFQCSVEQRDGIAVELLARCSAEFDELFGAVKAARWVDQDFVDEYGGVCGGADKADRQRTPRYNS